MFKARDQQKWSPVLRLIALQTKEAI